MDFKELVFISGKGGTGKSTVATTIARLLAQQGKKVLLAELEQTSSIQALLQKKDSPEYKPSPTGLGFDWSLIQGVDCLVEYVSSFTRLESMTQKIFESSFLKTLINVAPGLNDLSILGKLTSHAREHGPAFEYDHVVVDAPSTGSFYSLMKAPRTLGESVTRGPLHKQSFAIDEVLKDPARTQYLFVSLFEELPMDELEDTLAQFHDDYAEQMTVVMNKALPISKSIATDDEWFEYITRKIKQQDKQGLRAKELWPRSLRLDLFLTDFSTFLTQQPGRSLRPL